MSDWIAMADNWPAIGEWVLTANAKSDWPCVVSNRLVKGDGVHGREVGLFYWDSGDDFDDVTHWQPMPQMPSKEAA